MEKNYSLRNRALTNPLTSLLDQMADHGATKFYAKRLAPNDNSKNQVYLGGGFGALNIIPHGAVESDDSDLAGAVRDRAKAKVNFFWLDAEGLSPAPDAQLILYPKYPEVRMSGFLRGAVRAPGALMRSRDEGRIMFFGVCADGRVLGRVEAHDDPVARAFNAAAEGLEVSGVFTDLGALRTGANPKQVLLATLRQIHEKGWIQSQKMGKDGVPALYNALNGGGYTLEAELGIAPNGYSEPDFMGWEVKQYGVRDFVRYAAKSPVTLMTPEPTGGVYRDEGIETFLRRFGYPDKSGKADRINFGGRYVNGKGFHASTGLALRITGFDQASGKITDVDGSILLVDRHDTIAASWGFKGVIAHWNRKHAKAVYVPSLMRKPPPNYCYGAMVQLCEGTDVLMLISALASGTVYYDPGIKMENADTAKPDFKKRSQFRVNHSQLGVLYQSVVEQNLM
jgi:hypothetical protein